MNAATDWRKELGGILEGRARASRAEQETAQFEAFLQRVAAPALQQVAEELGRHGREGIVRTAPASATLTVRHGETEEIAFRVLRRSVPTGLMPYAEIRLRKGDRLVKTDGTFRDRGQAFALDDVTAEDIIRCFLKHYRTVMDAEQG
jgi:hypothetical protein